METALTDCIPRHLGEPADELRSSRHPVGSAGQLRRDPPSVDAEDKEGPPLPEDDSRFADHAGAYAALACDHRPPF